MGVKRIPLARIHNKVSRLLRTSSSHRSGSVR